ncbi:MAG: hypothetical protein RR495_04160 [Anaerovoracaceae bacterium]
MSSKMKISIDTKKLFYLTTIVSVLLFIIGNVITVMYNPLNNGVFGGLSRNYFDMLTMFVPFSMWAWLIIFGTLFVKKNWVVVAICVALAIPHIILIVVLHAYSYNILEILKWYVMILSFGTIIL